MDKSTQRLIAELRRDAEFDCCRSTNTVFVADHVCYRAADEIESLQSQLKECRDKLTKRDKAIEVALAYYKRLHTQNTELIARLAERDEEIEMLEGIVNAEFN